MIYKKTDNVVIDSHGYRILEDGKPINYNKVPLKHINSLEVEKALKFVECLQSVKDEYTINSYDLKHDVERFLRSGTYKDRQSEAYISNGALIVAMIKKGFNYQLVSLNRNSLKEYLSVVLYFNVSEKHYRAVRSAL